MKQLLGILLCMMLALPQQSFAQQHSTTSKKTREMKMYWRVVDSFTSLAIVDSKITLMALIARLLILVPHRLGTGMPFTQKPISL